MSQDENPREGWTLEYVCQVIHLDPDHLRAWVQDSYEGPGRDALLDGDGYVTDQDTLEALLSRVSIAILDSKYQVPEEQQQSIEAHEGENTSSYLLARWQLRERPDPEDSSNDASLVHIENGHQSDGLRGLFERIWLEGKKKAEFLGTYWLDKIPRDKLANARQTHNLDIHVDIWMLRDHTFFGSASDSTLIGEHGVSHYQSGDFFHQRWEELHGASMKEETLILYLDEERTRHDPWGMSMFGAKNKKARKLILKLFEALIEATENPLDDLREAALTAWEEERWQDGIEALEEFASYGGEPWFVETFKANCLVGLGRYREAQQALDRVVELIEKHELGQGWLGMVHLGRGKVALAQERHHEATFHFRKATNATPEIEEEATRSLLQAEQHLSLSLDNLPYAERQLVYVADRVPEQLPSNFMCLSHQIARDLKFPLGHPQPDQLYIAHPHLARTYMELGSYQVQLFQDKLMELSFFLQSLGASELVVSCDTSEFDEETLASARMMAAGANDVLGRGGALETNSQEHVSGASSEQKRMQIAQRFHPTRAPFIPEGLVWYPHETSWQRLAQQRLQGGIIDYQMSLSTEDVVLMSSSRQQQTMAEFDVVFASASATISTSSTSTTQGVRKVDWRIKVKFAPAEQLISAPPTPAISGSDGFSDAAEEYRDFVRECLMEDGELDTARRLLLRWASRLKVPAAECERIEAEEIAALELDEDEKAYLDEVLFCLEDDGVVDSQERKFLDRFAQRLGLDPTRVAYVEALAKVSGEE